MSDTKSAKSTRLAQVQVRLGEAYTWDARDVTELTLRRPRVSDQLEAQRAADLPQEQEIHLFARLCGVNPELIEHLDMADYRALQDAYSRFLRH